MVNKAQEVDDKIYLKNLMYLVRKQLNNQRKECDELNIQAE